MINKIKEDQLATGHVERIPRVGCINKCLSNVQEEIKRSKGTEYRMWKNFGNKELEKRC